MKTNIKAGEKKGLIELATELGDIEFARIIRTGAYLRIFPGIAAEAAWWSSLKPNGRYLARCVAISKARPGIVLTKLSAAVALGAQILGEPKQVTIAAAPGNSASHSLRKNIKVGRFSRHGGLAKQRVTLYSSGSTEHHEVLCTSVACTIYDIAAAYPIEESLIAINSLLAVGSDKRKKLPDNHKYFEKGKDSRYLNNKAVADILRAKTPASFKTHAMHYRQHGLKYEGSAMLLDECLELVWRNRGRRGVRSALLALLLATDKCESAGESLASVAFHKVRYEQPHMQIDFYKAQNGRTIYRVDGIWDLRSHQIRKRKPFEHRIRLGGTAPPGSKQALLYEFDGKIKYEDVDILGGKNKGDVLEEQNEREAGLRAMGYELVRLIWADLRTPEKLIQKLSRFGIPKLTRKPRRDTQQAFAA